MCALKDDSPLHPSISISQRNGITSKVRSGMGGKWHTLAGRKSEQESQKDKGNADKTEGEERTVGEQTGRDACKEPKP